MFLNADIDVHGKGYQGVVVSTNGSPDNCSSDPDNFMVLPSATTSVSPKGQGIVVDDPATNGGRAPRANGGGGGISGDTGGGGGSNFGSGGKGGKRWCDKNGAEAGGLGGVEMSTFIAQNRIFFGGAGGAGFVTNANPASAAHGGGMVIIRAKTIIATGSTIDASGSSPVAANFTGAPDGGGGGGGGGSVVFEIQNFQGTLDINVSGGNGQDLNTSNYHGPGGGGGGGAFLYNLQSLPAGITVNAESGKAGVHTDGWPHGAVDGTAGGEVSYFNLVYSEEDSDNDNISDYCDLDTDNDGILDSDEDGYSGFDPSKDADNDGTPNYKDSDDTSPGFPLWVDTNGDGINDIYDRDKDHIPDFKDLDSDNDGIVDAVEAGGVADATGAHANYTDTDLDGLNDEVDADNGGTALVPADNDGDGAPNYLDMDSDNDGVSDAFESTTSTIATGQDQDNDGIDNAFDADEGGSFNTPIDHDGDTYYDMYDIDSDNDGMADYYETSGIAPSGSDDDNDGIDNVYDVDFTGGTDLDGDWIDDNLIPADTDMDGLFDINDIDADADGIVDNIEGQSTAGYIAPSGSDTDNDGLDNAYDTDNGGTTIIPNNIDGDLLPDFQDTNSDEDPESDLIEAYDTDNDGVANILPSGTDSDNDGLDDNYDDISGFNPTDGGELPTDYPDVDNPGDDRDWRQNVPSVSLALDEVIITEAAEVATFTVSLNQTTYQPVTIILSYSGTAVGADYNSAAGTNATNPTTVVIPTGLLSGTVSVTSIDDASVELAETIILDVTSVTNALEDGVQQKTTTISDNDAPGITVSAISNATNEDGQTATFTIVLNSAPSNPVTINLSSDNTAEGTPSLSSVVFDAGDWSTAKEITVNPVDDAFYELDQAFNIITSNASSSDLDYNAMVVDDVAVVNGDNDNPPTVTLSADNNTIAENGGISTLTATLSHISYQDVTVTLGYTGTATGSGTDYSAGSTTITISAGNLTGTTTITAVDDAAYEGNETVIADITNVTNGSEDGTQQETVSITDAESEPNVSLSASLATIAENGGISTLTATLSHVSYQEVTVTLGYTGTATGSGTDYSAGSTTITISAGNLTGTTTITAVDDAAYEGNETVIADITNVTNGSEDGNQSVTITITDDDNAPVITINDASETEGSNVQFTVNLSNPSNADITVTLDLTDGTAIGASGGAGADYDNDNIQVTISAGSTSTTVNVPTTSDAIDEDNETFTIGILSVDAGTTDADLSDEATGTINDDDSAPVITIDNASATEASNVQFSVNLSNPSDGDITVTFDLTDGTATGAPGGTGADYDNDNVQVTISAGSTSTTVDIPTTSDLADEPNETFVIGILSVDAGTADADLSDEATGTINDDDGAPTVSLSASPLSVIEDGGVSTITATLSNASVNDIEVTLEYTGSAIGSGTDYSPTSTTITIVAGSLNGTTTVTSVNDSIYEGDETVIVDIINVTYATENGTQQEIITITDDESAPINNAPVATDDTATVNEGLSVSGNLLDNDSDPDGDSLIISTTPVSVPSNGSVTISIDGSYIYIPNGGFTGTDSFEYSVCDNGTPKECATATVTITVNSISINRNPIAINDTATINEGSYATGNLLANDSDPDGDSLIISTMPVSVPSNGSVTISFDGTYIYTPEEGFTGTDSFEYSVCDNGTPTECATALVTIIVTKGPAGDNIFIPEGFSPNGDGSNEYFSIPGIEQYSHVSIQIFNRWGNIIYKQEHYENDWDGTSNVNMSIGSELPTGTYFYFIVIHDMDEKVTGFVYLNR